MELKPSTDFGAETSTARAAARSTTTSSSAPTRAWPRSGGTRRPPRSTPGSSPTRRSASTSSACATAARSKASCWARSGPRCRRSQPGGKYLVEAVVRTLGIGHLFSQGTVDSNEIWVELIARSGDRVIGRSGGIGPDGTVDPYSHFINVYMLDRDGNRIDRRNPQDIFVPLYNKQIPPGAGQVVHFGLEVPAGERGPITLEARVNYRKFDRTYHGLHLRQGEGARAAGRRDGQRPRPAAGRRGTAAKNEPSPIEATWQRWNDYGIGLFLEGATKGGQKGELKQAEEVFRKVAELGRPTAGSTWRASTSGKGASPMPWPRWRRPPSTRSPRRPGSSTGSPARSTRATACSMRRSPSFESVLATKVPERKLRLQPRLRGHQRTRLGALRPAPDRAPVKGPARRDYLEEDDRRLPPDARDRLRKRRGPLRPGLAYGDPAWGARPTGELPRRA